MADKKISQLPNGNLTSSTIFPIVTNGITSKTTFSDIQSEIGAGNSYILGFQADNELGTTVTIGKGIGKIRFTEGSDTFVGVDGANFNDTGIGSVGYSNEMTIIISENQRRYVSIDNIIDNTNGVISMIYFDNQEDNSDSNIWYSTSGDYEYYPYFISSTDGDYSYAEGYATQANGQNSHAEGYRTVAGGSYSHAEGFETQANGDYSHTEGSNTSTTQENSHAGGYQSQANGVGSFIHGYNSQVNGNYSIVLGRDIIGDNDDTTYVDNLNIKRFGSGTLVRSIGVDADGYVVSGTSDSIWASGTGLGSIMSNSALCGQTASGSYSLSEGYLTRAEGSYSYAQGYQTRADGDYSHAQGQNTRASGINSYAEGFNTISSGNSSHAEGYQTVAGEFASHAEGAYTQSEGNYSHAEGISTIATGDASHAEGENTRAQGQASHAGGGETIANGFGSFVHGSGSTVNGDFSIVLGRNITGNTADTTYVDNIDIQKLLTLNVVTNSSPKDGDIWLESNTNTGLKIRISGVTKTITLT